ncbi:MAG: hypothetical protein HYR88_16440 [Verrucomicrobia bacterium]|nr:hypothetical protein [Verrucomicrobiota bacterium]MBI3868579.1 hypothetical protein [Verrucomicrobiota bacterium]
MNKIIASFAALAVASMLVTTATAADKEKVLKGEGVCAKCELKESAKCQNAIRVEEHGKKVVYYIEDNDVSKGFHKKVCTATIKLTATGKVSEKDGKKWLAASKLEETK